MSLMELFANPETIHNLSMGEKLAGAGITTLMGMGITFIISILLWAIIAMVAKIMSSKSSKPESKPEAVTPVTSASTPAAATTDNIEGNDPALIAVIAAAIAAYEGEDVVVSDLVVRRIRRIAGDTPAWASAGRGESIESRRV